MAKTKPWLSKVQVHLSRLWTDTQVQKEQTILANKKQGACTGKIGPSSTKEEVRVHLPRLWTDTQVQKS